MSGKDRVSQREVQQLRLSYARGEGGAVERIQKALHRPIRSAKAIEELHDLLLFLEAYPRDLVAHGLALHGMRQLLDRCAELFEASPDLRERLAYSGLPGTQAPSVFSYGLVRWLHQEYPSAVGLHSLDAPLDEACTALRVLLPSAAQEIADHPYASTEELLRALFGVDPQTQLEQLLRLLAAAPCEQAMRELLFSRLLVYVSVRADAAATSLSLIRGERGSVHCHPEGIRRGNDMQAAMLARLSGPVRLSRTAEQRLIWTARLTLCLMQRETDPITYASAVELFDMGRGLRIALFHLDLEHRLPCDSYIGFMAFKNGVPLAYGGAWIFPGKSKVGINVFPAMRGGESAWFFAQLLRLYGQRFGVERFEAENYQLGQDNPDGLRSGAYWFYYRAGFRPVDEDVAAMASHEAALMEMDREHRTPIRVLKGIVAEGLELSLTRTLQERLDTTALTVAVREYVKRHYDGDALRAERTAMRRIERLMGRVGVHVLSKRMKHAVRLWCLVLDTIPDLESWHRKDILLLVRILRAKAEATETRHQALLATHGRLLEALKALQAAGA